MESSSSKELRECRRKIWKLARWKNCAYWWKNYARKRKREIYEKLGGKRNHHSFLRRGGKIFSFESLDPGITARDRGRIEGALPLRQMERGNTIKLRSIEPKSNGNLTPHSSLRQSNRSYMIILNSKQIVTALVIVMAVADESVWSI